MNRIKQKYCRCNRRFYFNSSAMTLTELLLATALVGIVMVGTISVDYAIRNSKRSASETSALALRTQALLMQLSRDAMLAVGDTNNPGIVEYNESDKNALCFRQDADGDPNTYTGDTWICYGHGSSWDFWQCAPIADPLPSPWTWSNCPMSTRHYMLSVEDAAALNIAYDGDGNIDHIEFSVTAIADKDSSAHPINNPTYTLSTQVKPLGVSQ